MRHRFLAGALAIVLGATTLAVNAGPLRDRLLERQAARSARDAVPGTALRDIPYGSDPRQRFDVYLPAQAVADAPVIFIAHGMSFSLVKPYVKELTYDGGARGDVRYLKLER